MRIGFVTQEYPPFFQGGAGVYAEKITRNVAARGHDIVVFTPKQGSVGSKLDECKGIKVVPISIPSAPFSMAFFWIKLRKAVIEEEHHGAFDIIHVNSVTHWFPGRKRVINAPQVQTIHHLSQDPSVVAGSKLRSSILGRGENNLLVKHFEGHCVRSSDRIIAVSDDTRMKLEARYGHTKMIVTIHEGTDLPPAVSANDLQQWKVRLGIDKEKVLLFVGRLNDPRKGLDLLLKALSLCAQKDSLVLVIVGQGDQQSVIEQSNELGIADRIRLVGFVEQRDLWGLYSLCDLHVVPSRLEGFGLTLLEAAAVGKKVVATKVGAIPEISGPGVTLVKPGNPMELADGIQKALNSNHPLADVIREDAARYNWSNVALLTERVYIDVKTQAVEGTKASATIANK